ncbi:MAG TPA: hypothetical protein VGJ13_09525 [Pseudonocardiaceae bacterium]
MPAKNGNGAHGAGDEPVERGGEVVVLHKAGDLGEFAGDAEDVIGHRDSLLAGFTPAYCGRAVPGMPTVH